MNILDFKTEGKLIYVKYNSGWKKIEWISAPDLMKFGTSDSTMQERYELAYRDRLNKVRNSGKLTQTKPVCSNTSTDKTVKKQVNHSKYRLDKLKELGKDTESELTSWEIVYICDNYIKDLAVKLRDKYNGILRVDTEDIEQDIRLLFHNSLKDKKLHYKDITKKIGYLKLNAEMMIMSGIDSQNTIMGLPVHIIENINAIRKAAIKLTGTDSIEDINLNDTELISDISDETHFNERKVKEIVQVYISCVNEKHIDLGEVKDELEDEESLEEIIISKDDKEYLLKIISTLTAREAVTVGYRFGFINDREYSLGEIGSTMSLSRERIRQLEHSAMRKMYGKIKSNKVGTKEELRHLIIMYSMINDGISVSKAMEYFTSSTKNRSSVYDEWIENRKMKEQQELYRRRLREKEEMTKKIEEEQKLYRRRLREEEAKKIEEEIKRSRIKFKELKDLNIISATLLAKIHIGGRTTPYLVDIGNNTQVIITGKDIYSLAFANKITNARLNNQGTLEIDNELDIIDMENTTDKIVIYKKMFGGQ